MTMWTQNLFKYKMIRVLGAVELGGPRLLPGRPCGQRAARAALARTHPRALVPTGIQACTHLCRSLICTHLLHPLVHICNLYLNSLQRKRQEAGAKLLGRRTRAHPERRQRQEWWRRVGRGRRLRRRWPRRCRCRAPSLTAAAPPPPPQSPLPLYNQNSKLHKLVFNYCINMLSIFNYYIS